MKHRPTTIRDRLGALRGLLRISDDDYNAYMRSYGELFVDSPENTRADYDAGVALRGYPQGSSNELTELYKVIHLLCTLGSVEKTYMPPQIDADESVLRNQILFERIVADDLNVRPGEKVLELGCGCGAIASNLSALQRALNVETPTPLAIPPCAIDTTKLLWRILDRLPRDTAIVIEGSSHQSEEEQIVAALRFREVYFEPRGGALGMAMPMAVGISLHSGTHTVCLLGDGGSMYSIHSIWTAAHYGIPVVFTCVVNHEYEILKQLWKLRVPGSKDERYGPIMDLENPELDLHGIAAGFGGRVAHATPENFEGVLASAFDHRGPTFITVDETDLVSRK